MKKTTVKAPRRRRPKAMAAPDQAASSNEAYYSRAVARALDVLECFPDGETRLSLMEIGRLAGLPESSLFRILVTLETRGYLSRNADGSYRLAPILLLGKLHERANLLRTVVHPFLRELNNRFNETVSTAFLFEDKIQVIDTVETFHEIRISNTVGRVLPPHCSSLGMAVTAFQPKEKINRILQVYGLYARTERTITDRSELLAEFERIRERGYATDQEASVHGGYCCGAPLRDETDHVVGAISISTPVIRMNPEREAEMTRAVVEACKDAEAELKTAFRAPHRMRHDLS